MSRANTSPERPYRIDWVSLTFIVGYHLILLAVLPFYFAEHSPSATLIGSAVALWALTLVSITAGVHRLYAHRTYKTVKAVEWVIVFFSTLAVQGSILRWAHDHRLHHSNLDKEGDPYGTQKGFWHSHLLWMFKDRGPMQERYMRDLLENKLLVFQHKYYGWLMVLTNVIATAFVAWITGDVIGAIVIAFLLRLFVAHHCTWFINSLAHMWGAKPYSTEHSAVNNFILALLTYGEGYHNYHHTFATDYRNGIRWYQFDPPKYLIWLLSKMGLAWDLKKTDPLMIQKQLVQADRKLLMEHLDALQGMDTSPLVASVEKTHKRISDAIASAKTVMDRYRHVDRKKNRSEFREMKRTFREINEEIGRELKTWRRLCNEILKLEPVPVRA